MELTKEELEERVSILRRFRSLLEQQRDKFREYLTVLEKQQDSIRAENPESLLAHTELEQQVVKNLSSLHKVIVPMSKMYKNLNISQGNSENEDSQSIIAIQNELLSLQNKVLEQNKINRDLLRVHIENIKIQIQNFKNPYKNLRTVYKQPQRVATMIEVQA